MPTHELRANMETAGPASRGTCIHTRRGLHDATYPDFRGELGLRSEPYRGHWNTEWTKEDDKKHTF